MASAAEYDTVRDIAWRWVTERDESERETAAINLIEFVLKHQPSVAGRLGMSCVPSEVSVDEVIHSTAQTAHSKDYADREDHPLHVDKKNSYGSASSVCPVDESATGPAPNTKKGSYTEMWLLWLSGGEDDFHKIAEQLQVDYGNFSQSAHFKSLLQAVALRTKELTYEDFKFCTSLGEILKKRGSPEMIVGGVEKIITSSGVGVAKKSAAGKIMNMVKSNVNGFLKRTVDGTLRTDSFPLNCRETLNGIKNARSPLEQPTYNVLLYGGTDNDLDRVERAGDLRNGIPLQFGRIKYGRHYRQVTKQLHELKIALEQAASVETGVFSVCGLAPIGAAPI